MRDRMGPRQIRPRRQLLQFVVGFVLVIGILMGLETWSVSVIGGFGDVSMWQLRLARAIGLGAVLILFWLALRAGRGIGWLGPVLLATGAMFHVYRILIFSGFLSRFRVYTVARARVPDEMWLPLYLLFSLFAMGVWGSVDRIRARRVPERILHHDLPIVYLAAFLMIHYALWTYTRWAGLVSFDSNVLWPSALGVGIVLRPVLLTGAFYALNAVSGVPRKRSFEWALAGILLGLALIVPRFYPACPFASWAAAAGTDVAAIGLAAWILPTLRRYGRITVTDERPNREGPGATV